MTSSIAFWVLRSVSDWDGVLVEAAEFPAGVDSLTLALITSSRISIGMSFNRFMNSF